MVGSMTPFKQAATLVMIVWHSLRLSYLSALIDRQMRGRGWADQDAEEALRASQIALQIALHDFTHGAM
jgi:hypothetical protein